MHGERAVVCGDAGRGAVPVVDGEGVGGAVLVLVVRDHHWDVGLREARDGEGDADVAAVRVRPGVGERVGITRGVVERCGACRG